METQEAKLNVPAVRVRHARLMSSINDKNEVFLSSDDQTRKLINPTVQLIYPYDFQTLNDQFQVVLISSSISDYDFLLLCCRCRLSALARLVRLVRLVRDTR